MYGQLNTKGFDLTEVGHNEWAFNIRGGTIVAGSFKEVVKSMVHHGFELSEVEYAVSEMVRLGHDAAHFGMFMSLIFTFNREEKYGKAS